jgi:hypothetical protein
MNIDDARRLIAEIFIQMPPGMQHPPDLKDVSGDVRVFSDATLWIGEKHFIEHYLGISVQDIIQVARKLDNSDNDSVVSLVIEVRKRLLKLNEIFDKYHTPELPLLVLKPISRTPKVPKEITSDFIIDVIFLAVGIERYGVWNKVDVPEPVSSSAFDPPRKSRQGGGSRTIGGSLSGPGQPSAIYSTIAAIASALFVVAASAVTGAIAGSSS